MPNVTVERVARSQERALPVFAELERALDRVRSRAFERFEERGGAEGRSLDDWFAAERDVGFPLAELLERDADYVARIALPGFTADDVAVTMTPRELVVHAESRRSLKRPRDADDCRICWSEFLHDDVYRQLVFPTEIDVEKVTAVLRQGLLEVVAGKAGHVSTAVPVAPAA
jgi:HSP20 family molecular chaperone IbpA